MNELTNISTTLDSVRNECIDEYGRPNGFEFWHARLQKMARFRKLHTKSNDNVCYVRNPRKSTFLRRYAFTQ